MNPNNPKLKYKGGIRLKQAKVYGKIAFLSTYPPRECAVGSFTEDLLTTLDHSDIINSQVIAVSNTPNCAYNHKVMAEIRQNERSDYTEIAKKLNDSNIDILVIEHDYSIYGGDEGDYILDLIEHLQIPIVTILHSIMLEPNLKQRFILHEIGKKSAKVITMARNTAEMLQSIYGIEAEKIEFIHHGVPKKPLQPQKAIKKKFGFEEKQVISTFGLIGPGKGIELGIEAISKVIHSKTDIHGTPVDHKDILYLILGQTHPLLGEEGAIYRKKLEDLVDELDLRRNVVFINKYLSKDDIIQYLQLSDIYVSPYLEKDNAVSGTLAYAVGYGKAIVSTPYLYALEMLSQGGGLLVEFGNSDALADSIKQVLEEPFKKVKMERETSKIGRTMYWDKVAQKYTSVLINIITSASQIDVM
ncbi:MAG: glycosyltransferase family 4 protein [Vallitaleaceae bacterium]|nr:glycosyltransferase family 4 protein [Vallitaleaceae bacterium]